MAKKEISDYSVEVAKKTSVNQKHQRSGARVGRPPGVKKTGGRKKGSYSIKTLWTEGMAQLLRERNFDIIDKFIEVYNAINYEKKAELLMFVFNKIFPDLKAQQINMDSTITQAGSDTEPIVDALAIIREKITTGILDGIIDEEQ